MIEEIRESLVAKKKELKKKIDRINRALANLSKKEDEQEKNFVSPKEIADCETHEVSQVASLGEKLRKHRQEKGYSLDKLAEITDSSKSCLWLMLPAVECLMCLSQKGIAIKNQSSAIQLSGCELRKALIVSFITLSASCGLTILT